MTGQVLAPRFLPWLRSGLATQITTKAEKGLAPHDSASAAVSVQLRASGPGGEVVEPVQGPAVRLRGPGEVVGINPAEIVRRDPEPGAVDAEPTYFAQLELASPDLPWRFTPAAPDGNGRLQPWIALVVVEERDGVWLEDRGASLPALRVEVEDLAVELPDLAQCWAWAHVHADHDLADGVAAALAAQPEAFRSRLLCPRRLPAGRSWLACVVPTFEAGRRAGLGEAGGTDLGLAWSLDNDSARLPVYSSWRFATGERGDFESLVRRLRPRELPASVGRRDLDLSDPGGGLPSVPGTVVSYEGGLLSPARDPRTWPADHREAMKAALRRTLNRQLVRGPIPAPYDALRHDPVVGPPAYAAPQAHRRRVPPEGEPPVWFEELNTEPQRRTVAGLGAEVVRTDQEALLAVAWEHAASLREVNGTLRRARLAWDLSLTAKPAFDRLGDEDVMQLAGPAMARLAHASGTTIRGAVAASALPAGLVSGAFRRLTRTTQGFAMTARTGGGGVVKVAATGPLTAALLADPVAFVGTWADVHPPLGANVEGAPPDEIDDPLEGEAAHARRRARVDTEARRRRQARLQARLREHQRTGTDPGGERILRAGDFTRPVVLDDQVQPYQGQVEPVANLARDVRAALDPAATIVQMVEHRVVGLPADRDHDVPPGLPAHPRFTTPMYERLLLLSVEYLLPGIGVVPDDTLGLLEVNRPFVEAFLAGLNFELGREFLWREYPARLDATWARQFWDTGPGGAADIAPIGTWDAATGLGTHPPQAATTASLVLLVKGALPRRYPDLRVYAVKAEWTPERTRRERVGGGVELPLFAGRLGPDVHFYGFALTELQARGSTDPERRPGWFFVLEERPRAARFGLDAPKADDRGKAPANWSKLSWGHLVGPDDPLPGFVATDAPPWLTGEERPGNGPPEATDRWARDAAAMARITFQRPVRMLVHADAMLPEGGSFEPLPHDPLDPFPRDPVDPRRPGAGR